MIANEFYARSVETSLFDIIISHCTRYIKRKKKKREAKFYNPIFIEIKII